MGLWGRLAVSGLVVVLGVLATATSSLSAPLGTVTDFSAGPGAHPYGIAASPDGSIWFTNMSESGPFIGRITANGEVTSFPVSLSSGSELPAIAAGPDGDMWFTEGHSNSIGRITPTGEVTEFSAGPIPERKERFEEIVVPELVGIALGPDGNMWFTDSGEHADRVGRITPGGEVTEFSTGITSDSEPYGITAGPDGNMWFTETSASKIGRITPAGNVTEFSLGATVHPNQIVAGPDAALWFTEQGHMGIGRITTTGEVTEFPVGPPAANPGFSPFGITVGPDGNIWFAEFANGLVGRMTLTGAVTLFSTGASTSPLGIAAGSDGNVWFTEWGGQSHIGRVTLESSVEMPTITSVAPSAGPTVGGTPVTVEGTGLTGATDVKFGSISAPAVCGETQCTTIAPAGNGTVAVTVTTAGGTSIASETDRFTYVSPPTITKLSVKKGSANGGTPVTISGTGFTPTSAVRFGTVSATSVEFISMTAISVIAPANTAGTVDVTVTSVGGASPSTKRDRFKYTKPSKK